jgi:hypothetical protein
LEIGFLQTNGAKENTIHIMKWEIFKLHMWKCRFFFWKWCLFMYCFSFTCNTVQILDSFFPSAHWKMKNEGTRTFL